MAKRGRARRFRVRKDAGVKADTFTPEPEVKEPATRKQVLTMQGTAHLRFAAGGPKMDIRFSDGEEPVGYSVDVGRGAFDPYTVEEGREIAKAFSIYGERYFLPLFQCSLPAESMDDERAAATVFDGERNTDDELEFLIDGPFAVECGVANDQVTEFFAVGKAISGTLILTHDGEEMTASLSRGLPLVACGHVPSAGCSGLPSSLEKAVPAEARWWGEGSDPDNLDRLLSIGFFDPDSVLRVAGVPCKVEVEKRFYAFEPHDYPWGVDAAKTVPQGKPVYSPFAEEDWRQELLKREDEDCVVVLDPPDLDVFPADRLVRRAKYLESDWLLVHSDTPEARDAFGQIGRVFKLRHPGAADRVFVASYPVTEDVVWLDKGLRSTTKPFAGYATFDACVSDMERAGHSEEVARRICGALQRDVEKAGKYDHIDFKPPKSVADAAAKGLDFRKRAGGKGGLTAGQAAEQGIGSGVVRASSLKNRQTLSPGTVRQMSSFFSRHAKNKTINPKFKGEPWRDRGYVAWLLWGGDPGQGWAGKIIRQMEAADRKAKAKADLSKDADVSPSTLADPGLDTLLEGARVLFKADADKPAEERFVYGVVLEPDGVDAQQDTISPAEIRTAAHKFMEEYGNVGLQHSKFINGRVKILESFVTPADVRVAGELIKEGTWMFGVRVVDDDIWKAVKDGLITGFSIGGSAIREKDSDSDA